MKSSLALVVLALVCGAVVADDYESCKADFKAFLGCVKSEHDKKSDADKTKAKEDRKNKANACFTAASCDAPDWDANPMGGGKGGPGKGAMGGMGDMPQVVKDCLKHKLMDKIGEKMNPCLSKKGIKNLNFSAMADMATGPGGFDMEGEGGGEAKAGFEGAMKAKFNAVKAVDKCAQKKGGDTNSVADLEKCLQKIKTDSKPAVCAVVKPCEAKVTTGDCKKRGEALAKALCQCKKEQEAEIAKKLKALGQSKTKVGIQELVKTVANDQEVGDMMQQVEQCYQQNNVEEPTMLKMAAAMLGKGGASGGQGAALAAAFSVNGSTVVIMGDMMALDAADDTECKDCP